MSGLPSGAVTFVFTDIEGSTRLVKALREQYAQVLAEHHGLVRAAIAEQSGYEVDTQGDAFFVAFAGAKQAVLCALQIQRALAAHDWPEGAPVRVRIGIHTGQAIPAGEGYTGLAVHRAARICAAARCGQVLVSQATQALVEDEEVGDPDGQGLALADLAIATGGSGDTGGAVHIARQAGQISGRRGWIARMCDYLLTSMLIEAGDAPAAEAVCTAALVRARDADDQWNLAALLPRMAKLDVRAGRFEDAARHLRDAVEVMLRTGQWSELENVLEACGHLCTATGRPAEAVTLFAAMEAQLRLRKAEFAETGPWVRRWREALRKAREVLGTDAARVAGERGKAMSAATASEYALLLTAPEQSAGRPEPGQLSTGERELVTLVAQGRTDAQIAEQLHISARTVRSRLDRIRDKIGCRRRADLTRLALRAGLV